MSRGLSPLGERFGLNLWRSRRRAGLTQEELAELVGIHRVPLGELERGVSLPRLDTVLKLAGGMNVSPCVLLAGMEWRAGRHVDGDFCVAPPAPRLLPRSSALQAIPGRSAPRFAS